MDITWRISAETKLIGIIERTEEIYRQKGKEQDYDQNDHSKVSALIIAMRNQANLLTTIL